MNKNSDNYKNAFSAFAPSDTAVEKVFKKTIDKKAKSSNVILRRIAAAALAFVVVIGGGFGINSAVNKNDAVSDKLGVMVVMAGEKEPIAAGKATDQDVFYGVYIADIEDEEAVRAAADRWHKDHAKLDNLGDKLKERFGNKPITRSYGAGSSTCYSPKLDKHTAAIYTLQAGMFILNKFDYSNVKDITIENTSQYGVLSVECWNPDYDLNEMDMDIYYEAYGQEAVGFMDYMQYTCGETEEKIILTKEMLTTGIEFGMGELWTSNGEINPGYTVDWDISEYLKCAIGDDINFDLSQIKDTIIFTVNYDDGTSEQASISLEFDSDGYMHIVDAQ